MGGRLAGFSSDHVQTYGERDARACLGVCNLARLQMFPQLCAHRYGILLSILSLASDLDTALGLGEGGWLSMLQTSHVVFLLRPLLLQQAEETCQIVEALLL